MKAWTDPLTGKRRENPVLSGVFKYHGGVLAADGNIYAIPATADRCLMIVPRTGEVRLVGDSLLEGLAGKWYGGLLGCNGSIYGMPCNADAVLVITPGAGEAGPFEGSDRGPAVSTIGSLPLGGWKYHGGMSSRSKDC